MQIVLYQILGKLICILSIENDVLLNIKLSMSKIIKIIWNTLQTYLIKYLSGNTIHIRILFCK